MTSLVVWVLLGCAGPDKAGRGQALDSGTDAQPTTATGTQPTGSGTGTTPTGATTGTGTGTATGTPTGTTIAVTAHTDPVRVHRVTFTLEVSPPAPASLSCTADDDPAEHHTRELADGDALDGLLADTAYTCTVDAGARATVAFRTPPAPDWLPTLDVEGAPEWGAYTLLSTWYTTRPRHTMLLVVDPEGRPRWHHEWAEEPSGGVEATWRPDTADFLAGGGKALPPTVLGLDGVVRWQGGLTSEGLEWHHDVIDRGDGTVTYMGQAMNTLDEDVWVGFLVESMDRATGAWTWTFNSQSAVDVGIGDRERGDDPYHANAIAIVPDDPQGPAIWTSLADPNLLLQIDETTGEPGWVMGRRGDFTLLRPDGTPEPDLTRWFYQQHDLQVAYPRMLLYDNGMGRDVVDEPNYSRAAEFEVDAEARTVRLLREWSEPEWYEKKFGGVDWLPNGHWHIVKGHSTDGARYPDARSEALEVDPDTGEVVHRLTVQAEDVAFYRGQRIHGCDLFHNRRYCDE